MNNNVVTHITTPKLHSRIVPVLQDKNLIELRIDKYEEFFHALIHVDPKLFIVEIDDLHNPYVKIIRIMKKSVLTKDVPIVAFLSNSDEDLIEAVAELDIQGIIYPPYTENVIKLILGNMIKLKSFQELRQLDQDMQTVQSVMISSLASLAEYRDPETGEHIKRTQNYVKALALALRKRGLYVDELTDEHIEAIYMSVPLHDIGKVGIRDDILLKPGRLTKEEFEIMKTHAALGHETVINVGSKLKNNAFLEFAADVAFTHHEKYDGSGYPRGLKGTDIPLVGRLMAVADVYDALTSKRVYKDAMSHEEAMEILKSGIGQHFDPDIVDCVIELEATFRNIAMTYKDADISDNTFIHMADLFSDKLLRTILVVEDSRIVREITKNQLASIGFEVDTAKNGLEGFEALVRKDYDLVLLDIEMPKMNGYEMATKILELKRHAILIAMTAADFNTNVGTLKEFGISGLVLKPIDFNRLAILYTEALRIRNGRINA